jgi:ATP-dependent DNA ligase
MTFDFCLSTRSTIVPDGPDWLHEINYDGYRFRAPSAIRFQPGFS